jgi:hypothetical protein
MNETTAALWAALVAALADDTTNPTTTGDTKP